MRFVTLALALVLPLTAAAQDIDKINGSISVNAGEHAGNVHSVNGAVNINDGAIVQDASTVNGAVRVGAKVQANSLHTVNGAIEIGQSSQVRGDVSNTNGGISLNAGAQVNGSLANVNGSIRLDHAHLSGGIETTSGDITIGEGSQVDGSILVHEQHGWNMSSRPPRVVIGPHAIVHGTLEFQREVVLQVSDSAQIGQVKGATPMRFSGSQPLE